jgi:hypothetical protein
LENRSLDLRGYVMVPVDPLRKRRDEALARLDLGRIYAQVLLYASSRAHSREEGQELAQRVFTEALEPNGSPWDPDASPDLGLFLIGRVRGALAQDRMRRAVRESPQAVGAIEQRFYSASPTPIDLFQQRRRAEEAHREWARLRASFDEEGDAFARQVLDQYEAGTTEAAQQALALGADIAEVYRERRRIARRARALRGSADDAKDPGDDGEVGT